MVPANGGLSEVLSPNPIPGSPFIFAPSPPLLLLLCPMSSSPQPYSLFFLLLLFLVQWFLQRGPQSFGRNDYSEEVS